MNIKIRYDPVVNFLSIHDMIDSNIFRNTFLISDLIKIILNNSSSDRISKFLEINRFFSTDLSASFTTRKIEKCFTVLNIKIDFLNKFFLWNSSMRKNIK